MDDLRQLAELCMIERHIPEQNVESDIIAITFLYLSALLRHVISVFSARDKSERAFGVAFVKLMNPDGTTLQDGRHDLVVYKVVLTE